MNEPCNCGFEFCDGGCSMALPMATASVGVKSLRTAFSSRHTSSQIIPSP